MCQVEKSGFFLFFFFNLFIKVLFSSSSLEAACPQPALLFFDFFFSGQGLLAQKQSRVVEVDRCMYRQGSFRIEHT